MSSHSMYSDKERRNYDPLMINNGSLNSTVMQYILNMYDEFKKCYEQRNIEKADKIIKNISNVDPDSNILNIIEGALYFYHGDGVNAYKYFLKYAKNSKSIDVWALNCMGMWNLICGNFKLAYKQFAHVLQGCADKRFADTKFLESKYSDTKFIICVLINAAKAKKRLGFYDKALEYYERLLRVPDGYKLMLIIKLEIIHIYILKKQYTKAMEEIDLYMKESDNFYIKRLKVYIYFLNNNFKEILKYKNEEEQDPYILYIIARVGIENSKAYSIDIPYFLDEAIKSTKQNEYFYNTYGIYYHKNNRFSDAAEQYNNALSLNPMFEPALSNLKLFLKANSKSNDVIYVTSFDKSLENKLSDVNPDVEELGFLDTWALLGYTPFRVDHFFLQKSPSLKYYISCD